MGSTSWTAVIDNKKAHEIRMESGWGPRGEFGGRHLVVDGDNQYTLWKCMKLSKNKE